MKGGSLHVRLMKTNK